MSNGNRTLHVRGTTPGFRLLRIAAAVCMAASLTGCVTIDETLTLRADGGGNYHLTYSIPDSSVVMLRAIAAIGEAGSAARDGAAPPKAAFPLDIFLSRDAINAELARNAASGLTVEQVLVDRQHDTTSADVTISFTNLQVLARTVFFSGRSLTLADAGEGLVEIRHRVGTGEAGQIERKPQSVEEEREVAPFLRGFNYRTRMLVPGRVVRAGAASAGLDSAVWSYAYDTDPQAVQRLQNADMFVVFRPERPGFPVTDATKAAGVKPAGTSNSP